jgi:hypothetical protein
VILWKNGLFSFLEIDAFFFFSPLLFLQNHEWVKKAELEDVGIAGWVCRTTELLPATPTRVVPNFWTIGSYSRRAQQHLSFAAIVMITIISSDLINIFTTYSLSSDVNVAEIYWSLCMCIYIYIYISWHRLRIHRKFLVYVIELLWFNYRLLHARSSVVYQLSDQQLVGILIL